MNDDPENTTTIPRIGFDQLEPRLKEKLAPRVARLGYLGEFFQCAAHQPAALASFVDFTAQSKAALPDNLAEMVSLTVAVRLGNRYEANQHERLAVRLGLGRAWVAEVERCDPAHAELTDQERVVQHYVLTAADHHGLGAQDELADVVQALGAERAVAVLLVAARYVGHALVANSLDLAPPVASIFEDGFDV